MCAFFCAQSWSFSAAVVVAVPPCRCSLSRSLGSRSRLLAAIVADENMTSEHGIELGICENSVRALIGSRRIKDGPRLVALLAVSDSETRCMGLAICRWMMATTSMDLGDDESLFQSAVDHNHQKGLRAHGLLVYSVEDAWCSDFLLSSAWSSL